MKRLPSDPVALVRSTIVAELDDVRDGPVVVALSGGLDSCVLLHALRFSTAVETALVAAHFDHGMRSGSRSDAAWVRGVCKAWSVDLAEGGVTGSATVPTSEDEARDLRYAFLGDVAEQRGAVLLTAHHADDQAETVLFRALRGTGIEGLAGIPRRRVLDVDGDVGVTVVRPLLSLTRDDLEAYARQCVVPYRPDPSNESASFARNVLRRTILPLAEEKVAPGARRSLARLADIAREEEAAWAAAMRFVLPALDVRPGTEGDLGRRPDAKRCLSCRRDALVEVGPALAARVLRRMAGEHGLNLDRDTTRRGFAFVQNSQSGRYIELGRGVQLHLKEDRVIIVSSEKPETDPMRGSASLDRAE